VGTHKTGTTSLQAMLGANGETLRNAGVYVPQAGRIDRRSAGHHNIAWELRRDPRFDSRFGTLDALLREIANAGEPVTCITSEDFELLHADTAALERLRDGLLAIGYQPAIVLYLRPQADYAESLYAELLKAWDVGFEEYFEEILARGSYGPSLFDYDRLTAAFARTFGRDRLIVRAYQASAPPKALQREFVELLAPGAIPFRRLALPQRLNRMATFREVVALRARQVGCETHYAMPAGQRFDPLNLLDLARVLLRFSESNERVERAYGVRVGCVSVGTFAREVLTELLRDRASHFRKRLIRALVASELDIAA
jgi:hypothetical protein